MFYKKYRSKRIRRCRYVLRLRIDRSIRVYEDLDFLEMENENEK